MLRVNGPSPQSFHGSVKPQVPAKQVSLTVAFGGSSSLPWWNQTKTLRKKMRFSSSSVRDTNSRKLMASKSQNQSNRFTGNLFLTDLRHHQASSLSVKIVTKVHRACPRVTMKNLCLRRVFSPSSISSDWDFLIKEQNQTKELNVETPNPKVMRIGSKDAVGGGVATAVECSQTTPPESEMFTGELSLVRNEAGSINQVINGVSGIKAGTNLNSRMFRHSEKILLNPGSVSYRRLLPYLMEAADGTRDADVSNPKNQRGESMAVKSRLLETKPVLQPTNNFVKPSAQNLHGNSSPFKKMTSSSATKISLCSKRKLFKVPGSVNYKRMLSYLKDNSEDNPGTSETSKHIDPLKNIEINAPATENKGAATEAKDLNTCSNNVEAPLSDPEKEQETQTFVSSV